MTPTPDSKEQRTVSAEERTILGVAQNLKNGEYDGVDLMRAWMWLRELAALKSQQGWQDIETAPKDGTHILLLHKGAVLEAFWECVDTADWELSLPASYWWSSPFDMFDDGSEPTHWMPLPKGPQP